jgi:hypothetical protein
MKIRLSLLLFFAFFTCFSQIPSNNPIAYTLHQVTAYSIKVSFSRVDFIHSYLVLVSENEIVSAIPVNGKSYSRGDRVGNAKVVQCSLDTIFQPRAVRANTTYNFVVYACYEVKGEFNYILKKPLNIQVTTSGLSQVDYYESISITAPNFVSNLSNLLVQHTIIPYASYKNTVLAMLEFQDTTAGKTFVQCVYSGEKKIVEVPFDWTKAGYSREHTFAHSWMPSYPADNPSLPEYSDLHNLYPTNLEKANTVRNNFPLGEVTGKVLYTYLEGKLGYDGSQIVYEPRDAHKGNAARAMMYMSIAYNSQNSHNWSFPSVQSQETIKKWHFQDPPDNYEIARQEYIYWLQGNRNPFIDHPEYACYVDFAKMSKQKANCYNTLLEVENEPRIQINLSGKTLEINSEEEISEICIYDIMGQLVFIKSKGFNSNFVDLTNLGIGTFIVYITSVTEKKIRKKIYLN